MDTKYTQLEVKYDDLVAKNSELTKRNDQLSSEVLYLSPRPKELESLNEELQQEKTGMIVGLALLGAFLLCAVAGVIVLCVWGSKN